MAQNGTKTELTNKQCKVAERLANPDCFSNHSEIMEEFKIPRSTFYRWLRDEKFMKYVSDLVDKYTDAHLPDVWKALIDKCKKGDTLAMRLYFELKEKYTPKINISADERVQIINDIPLSYAEKDLSK